MTNAEWELERLHQLKQFGERVSRYDEDELLIVSVDDNFCNMLGYTRAELLIHSCGKVAELVYAPDLDEIRYKIRKDLREKGRYTCRYRIRKKDGVLIWVWECGLCEKDEKGKDVIRSLVVDVSKEEEIRRERDTTYDNIPGGVMTVLVTDTNFYIMEANHQYFSMVGTTREQYLGSSGIYTYPQDLPGLRNHIIEQAGKQEPIEYDFRTRHPKYQDTRWYRMLGRHYREVEEGCEYLCILLDVTEQKSNLFQLEREKERYRITSGINAHILFEYDLEKKQLQLYEDNQHKGFRLCMELTQKGTLGEIMRNTKLLHPDDEGILDMFSSGNFSSTGQLRLLTEDRATGKKSYQWYEYAATKVMEQGKVTRFVGSFKNIEEQKKQEEARKDIRSIYEIQSQKIYEMILRVTLHDHSVKGYFNDGTLFSDVYSSNAFDVCVKQTASQFVHPEEREQFLGIFDLDNMIEVLESSSLEEVLFFRIRKPGGDYRYKCFRYSYLGNDTDVIIISAQDVHELHLVQLKEEDADRKVMASALKEAKDMVEMRRNFLAILAREVKAPVQFISSTLRKPQIPESTLSEMRYASHYILEIIQNMTEYERIEQGKVRVENQIFSLESMMQNVIDVWMPRSRRAGAQIEYSFDFQRDPYYGDEKHLRQIVDNVLGNSLMYSEPDNRIRVWGTVEERANNIHQLSLVLEDRGFPVQEDYFGRAYPLDRVNTRVDWKREEGIYCTTFSLVLARRLAELLGGRLELSRRGQNTNMIKLEIPLQKGREGSVQSLSLEKDSLLQEAVLNGYRILVVERENAVNDMVGVRLKVSGAQVDVAYTGKEGLELWNSYAAEPFDAVLVEGYLADMDYVGVARAVRKREGSGTVPLFVMVDEIRQESISTSMQEGVNAFLEKPLELVRLQQMLEAYYR